MLLAANDENHKRGSMQCSLFNIYTLVESQVVFLMMAEDCKCEDTSLVLTICSF